MIKNAETEAGLFLSAGGFRSFAAGLTALADMTPPRTSISQLVFFLLAARADLLGSPATFNEIREQAGPIIGKGLHSTYKLFFAAEDRSDKITAQSLGWLSPVVDRSDHRRKYLHLTKEGKAAMVKLLKAIDAKEYRYINA